MKLKCNTCDGIFDTVDIRFTKKCDNNCAFCIEKKSTVGGKNTDVDKIMESVLKTGTDEVLILGGEPFLKIDELLESTRRLKESGMKIYITTSLPYNIILNWNTFNKIMNNITGLNVSVHHYNSDINNDVYMNHSHDRLKLLERVVRIHDDKVRVCVNLVNGFIDKKYKLYRMLCELDNIGVKNVKVNELCHSDDYVSYENMMGIKMGSPYATGCYTKVSPFPLYGINIELKRSCFITEATLSASFMDMVKVVMNKWFVKPLRNKFCVVYENGEMKSNWVTK